MEMQRVQNGQTARRSRHSAAPESVSGKARPAAGRLLAPHRRGEEGQALVETALSMSVLLLVLTGLFVFTINMYHWMLLQTAASEGVQVLALGQNVPGIADPCTDATTKINQATSLNSSSIKITFWNGAADTGALISAGSTCEGIAKGTQLTVKLTYPCSNTFIYNYTQGGCALSVAQSEPAQ